MALIDPNSADRERRATMSMMLMLGLFVLASQFMIPEPPPGPAGAPSEEIPLVGDAAAVPSAPAPEAIRDDLVLTNEALTVLLSNRGAAVPLVLLRGFAPPGHPELRGVDSVEAMHPFAQTVETFPDHPPAAPGAITHPDFRPAGLSALRLEGLRPRDALIATSPWQVKDDGKVSGDVVFATSIAGGIGIEKVIRFARTPWGEHPQATDPHRLEIEVRVTNQSRETLSLGLSLFGLSGSVAEGDVQQEAIYRSPQVGYLDADGAEQIWEDLSVTQIVERIGEAGKDADTLAMSISDLDPAAAELMWLALGNHYFAGVLAPDAATRAMVTGIRLRPVVDSAALAKALASASAGADPAELRAAATHEVSGAFDLEIQGLKSGETRVLGFQFFVGPRAPDVIEPMGLAGLVRTAPICGVIHVGPFARALTWCLSLAYRATGNYGWAIILLTIVIKVILMPINFRNQLSMARFSEKMKKVAPRQKEIEAKFKGRTDPQSLRLKQVEMTQAMRDAGITVPLPPGCLVMALQMPIFVGLYSALQNSIEMRHQPWLWVADLGAPDKLATMTFAVPYFGADFNILPLIMTVVWWLQAHMSAKLQPPATGAMSEQMAMQMKMMVYMPIIFGIMFYHGPSGLVLYWTLSTAISIFELVAFRGARERAIARIRGTTPAAS